MRLDRLLWFLRLASSRSFAQDWIMAGHIRLNGRRIERTSAPVKPGDVLVLPMRDAVRVIELLAVPARRGPLAEARACYRALDDMLDEPRANPIAAGETITPEGNSPP